MNAFFVVLSVLGLECLTYARYRLSVLTHKMTTHLWVSISSGKMESHVLSRHSHNYWSRLGNQVGVASLLHGFFFYFLLYLPRSLLPVC